jgi:NTE family protein
MRWRCRAPPRRRRRCRWLSSITIKNYGGTCNYIPPGWAKPFLESAEPQRPAARALRSIKAEQSFTDSVHRPYLHLVDGGVSDNVGMRSVLDSLEILESLHAIGRPTPLDSAKRIIVFIVNSLSSPPTNWDESETPPGTWTFCSRRRALRSAPSPTSRSKC